MARKDNQADFEQDLADSRYPQQQQKRTRVYQEWKGNEFAISCDSWEHYNILSHFQVFFCYGMSIGGPGWKASLLTGLFIFAPAFLFLWFVAFQLRSDTTIAPGVVGCVVAFVSLYFLFLTAFSDPGIIPRQEPDLEGRQGLKPSTKDVNVNGHTVTIRYNATCNFYQPPRAHHCSVNDNCIERFDHHCPWIGTTIGLRNYRSFLLFIHVTSLLCLYVVAFCTLYAVRRALSYVEDYKAKNQGEIPKPHLILRNNGVPWAMALFLFSGLGFLFVGCLTFFHLWLISKNQTTYENFRYASTKRQNPYDRGCFNNCKEVWCLHIPKSRIQARRYRQDVEQPKSDLPINMYLREPYSDYYTRQNNKSQELQNRSKNMNENTNNSNVTNSQQSRNQIQFGSNNTNYTSQINSTGDQSSQKLVPEKRPSRVESIPEHRRQPLPDQPSKIHYVQANRRASQQPHQQTKGSTQGVRGGSQGGSSNKGMSEFDSNRLFMPSSQEEVQTKAISMDSDDSNDSSPRITKSGNQKKQVFNQANPKQQGVIGMSKAMDNSRYVKPAGQSSYARDESASNPSYNDSLRDGKHLLGSELSYDSVNKQYKMSDANLDRGPVENNSSLFRQDPGQGSRSKAWGSKNQSQRSPKRNLNQDETTDQARDQVRRQYMTEIQEYRNKQRSMQGQQQERGGPQRGDGGRQRHGERGLREMYQQDDQLSDKGIRQNNLVGSDRNLGNFDQRPGGSNKSRSLIDMEENLSQGSTDFNTFLQGGSNLRNNRQVSNGSDLVNDKPMPGNVQYVSNYDVGRQAQNRGQYMGYKGNPQQQNRGTDVFYPGQKRPIPTVTPIKPQKSREQENIQGYQYKNPVQYKDVSTSSEESQNDRNFELSLNQDGMMQQQQQNKEQDRIAQLYQSPEAQHYQQKHSPRESSRGKNKNLNYDKADSSLENAEYRKQTRLKQMERLRKDDASSQDSLKQRYQQYQQNQNKNKRQNAGYDQGSVQPNNQNNAYLGNFAFQPQESQDQNINNRNYSQNQRGLDQNTMMKMRNQQKAQQDQIPKQQGLQVYGRENQIQQDVGKGLIGGGEMGEWQNRRGEYQSPTKRERGNVGSDQGVTDSVQGSSLGEVDRGDSRRARLKKYQKEFQDNHNKQSQVQNEPSFNSKNTQLQDSNKEYQMQGQLDRAHRQRMGKEMDDSTGFVAFRGTGSDFDRASNISQNQSNHDNIGQSMEDRDTGNSWKLPENEVLSSSKLQAKQISRDLQDYFTHNQAHNDKQIPQQSPNNGQNNYTLSQDKSIVQQSPNSKAQKYQDNNLDRSSQLNFLASDSSSQMSKFSNQVSENQHANSTQGQKLPQKADLDIGRSNNNNNNNNNNNVKSSNNLQGMPNQMEAQQLENIKKKQKAAESASMNQDQGSSNFNSHSHKSSGHNYPEDQHRYRGPMQLGQINEVIENSDNINPYKMSDYEDLDEEESFYNSQNIVGGNVSDINRSTNNQLNRDQIDYVSQNIRGSGNDINQSTKNVAKTNNQANRQFQGIPGDQQMLNVDGQGYSKFKENGNNQFNNKQAQSGQPYIGNKPSQGDQLQQEAKRQEVPFSAEQMLQSRGKPNQIATQSSSQDNPQYMIDSDQYDRNFDDTQDPDSGQQVSKHRQNQDEYNQNYFDSRDRIRPQNQQDFQSAFRSHLGKPPVQDPQHYNNNNNPHDYQAFEQLDQLKNRQATSSNRSKNGEHLYRQSSPSGDLSLAQTQFHSARGNSSRMDSSQPPSLTGKGSIELEDLQDYPSQNLTKQEPQDKSFGQEIVGNSYDDPKEDVLNKLNVKQGKPSELNQQDANLEYSNRSPSLRGSSKNEQYKNSGNNITHQLTMQNVAAMQSQGSEDLQNYQIIDKGSLQQNRKSDQQRVNESNKINENQGRAKSLKGDFKQYYGDENKMANNNVNGKA